MQLRLWLAQKNRQLVNFLHNHLLQYYFELHLLHWVDQFYNLIDLFVLDLNQNLSISHLIFFPELNPRHES